MTLLAIDHEQANYSPPLQHTLPVVIAPKRRLSALVLLVKNVLLVPTGCTQLSHICPHCIAYDEVCAAELRL